jgi:hypothetical protein
MSQTIIRILAVAASVALFAGLTHGQTIYVDYRNESGTEDGTEEFPYNTIGEGIENALGGNQVLVASGTYKESVLMKTGVDLIGSGPEVTTIDALGISNSAVTFNGTRANPLITGFTILGGAGDVRDVIGGEPVTVGGGIMILEGEATVRGNVIRNNVVDQGYCRGGGIYINTETVKPLIVDNVILDNVALSTTVAGDGQGGGIFVTTKNGGAVIAGNVISGNSSAVGGAVLVEMIGAARVDIERNRIRSNQAVLGGAIHLADTDGSTTRVSNNVIRGNGTNDPAGLGGGILALAFPGGAFTIANNTFIEQSVPSGSGGALYLDDSAATTADSLVANNIFVGNTAGTGGGIDHTLFAGTILRNDFFDNTGGDLYDAGGSTAILLDNLFLDPEFLSPVAGNYQLAPTSPLIDTADEVSAPVVDHTQFTRPFDGDGDLSAQSDLGAFEYPAGDVVGLFFSSSDDILEWPVLPQQDGFDFNVYRGSLSRLRATGEYTQDPLDEPMAAQTCGVSSVTLPFVDAYAPPVDEAVFYLVSLTQPDYEGGLGLKPDGSYRPNLNACP